PRRPDHHRPSAFGNRTEMSKRRLGRRKIDHHLSPIKQMGKIVGNGNTYFADTRRLTGILSERMMPFPFDSSCEGQSRGLSDQRDQPASHPASGPGNDDFDHDRRAFRVMDD